MRQLTTCISYLSLKAFIIVYLVAISACKKDAEPEPIKQTACLLTKTERQETGAFTTLKYDEKNRLISYFTHRPKNDFIDEQNITCTVVRNQADQIIRVIEDHGNDTGYNLDFEYDSKGRWSKTTTSYTPSGPIDLVLIPEYDTENKVTKVVKTTRDGSQEITTYEYTDGNMSKVSYETAYSKRTVLYEYDLEREAVKVPLEFFRIASYSSGSPATSKNTIKRTIPIGSTIQYYDYLNEYNEKGYLNKSTVTAVSSDGTSTITNVTINTYQCQ